MYVIVIKLVSCVCTRTCIVCFLCHATNIPKIGRLKILKEPVDVIIASESYQLQGYMAMLSYTVSYMLCVCLYVMCSIGCYMLSYML